MDPQTLVWAVPLLPLAGFAVNAFVGRHLPKPVVGMLACGTVLASAIISWVLFFHVRGSGPLTSHTFTWIDVPGLKDGYLKFVAEHKLVVDQLTAVMILVVTNVGFLIHVYSTGYMADDKRYSRYFAYLNLFTSFMLILVMGGNMFLMFVGWEGVGLCSYLLISFWYEKIENAKAGMKAFITNRVGDFAFTIGLMLLFVYLGTSFKTWTVDFGEMQKVIAENKGSVQTGVMTAVGILLFIGATGKSAQLPLYTWLPDAMAGPTPVSALIHAATMVTAGVYMVARMNFVYALSPTAMTVIAVVGGATALFAGTIGVAQNDIKKVLAYSTVSQLGFMFMGVGVGAWAAGIFHLVTHSFFKACLFLGSGSVIHGMGGEQDIRKMGGLKKYMPVTFWTFAIASVAIAGIPPLAGFWSKDEILWQAWSTHDLAHPIWGKLVWLMGAVAAAFTAFYMTRLVVLTFFGELRSAPGAHAHSGGGVDLPDWMGEEKKPEPGTRNPESPHGAPSAGHDAPAPAHDAGHGTGHAPSSAVPHDPHDHGKAAEGKHPGTPHESPPSMTIPLVVLAALSIVGGFLGMGAWMGAWTHMPNWFETWLAPVWGKAAAEHHDVPTAEYVFVLISVVIAVAGILFGWRVYHKLKGEPAKNFTSKHRELHELVRDKYRVDELYDAVVIEPLLELNETLARFDNAVVDGAVNGTASAGASTANVTGYFDNEVVDGGVNATAHAVQTTGRGMRRLQTGNIKSYVTSAVVGGLIVIGAYCISLKWQEIERFFKS